MKGPTVDSGTSPSNPPIPPPLSKQIWSLASALKDFIADGMQTVTAEQYEARLAVCDTCDQRGDNRCLNCGCLIPAKAKGRAWNCPLNRWPVIEAS